MKHLAALAREITEEEAESLADDRYILEEIRDLSSHLAIVSLYRVVELTTQGIIARRYKKPGERKQLYKIDALTQRLKRDLGLDLSSLKGFQNVNELRCLNNAIKHEGNVSKELHTSAPSRWVKGDPIADLSNHFERFAADYELVARQNLLASLGAIDEANRVSVEYAVGLHAAGNVSDRDLASQQSLREARSTHAHLDPT